METQTIRLPHSGIHVPHTAYTVTSYTAHETYDGVSFRATLRHHRKIVGTIENEGHGGPDTFYPTTFADSEHRDGLDAMAAHSRDANGGPVDTEALLGHLVTEFEIGREIKRHTKNGRVMLRAMVDYDYDQIDDSKSGPVGNPSMTMSTATDVLTAATPAKLIVNLTQPGLAVDGRYGWWQKFDPTQDRWIDVTARPAHLIADRDY